MLVFHIYFWKCLQFKIKNHSVSFLVLYALRSLNVSVGLVYYNFYFLFGEREKAKKRHLKKDTNSKILSYFWDKTRL